MNKGVIMTMINVYSGSNLSRIQDTSVAFQLSQFSSFCGMKGKYLISAILEFIFLSMYFCMGMLNHRKVRKKF